MSSALIWLLLPALYSLDNRTFVVHMDQWYSGASIRLEAANIGASVDAGASASASAGAGAATNLIFRDGTLSDGSTRPNDVCVNMSPTAGGGEALLLWVSG